MTIHAQLAPLIRAHGIRATGTAANVAYSTLSNWCAKRTPAGANAPPRLADAQLEAIAEVLGVKIIIK